MSTDFFQQQEHAKRSTTRLVVLFGLALLAIMVSLEVLLAAATGYLSRNPDTGAVNWGAVTDPSLILLSVVGTLVVVGGGSLYKISQLRAGGSVVAEQLGGRLLNAGTSDPVEQRLLNVVEEMAIASGTPTPPVYLMEQEPGINAFAAGFSPADAVIGVTRGTATQLSRDELQGVIAHEFSHILNGDMRLNLRLMGLLHGILIIGMLGYFVLRMSFYTGGSRRSKDGNSGLPIMAIGAGLAVIGFAGTFFGNLIKAAVSRQREFLADASAVQFTRQPEGIAGALKKIGGFATGSSVNNPNAPEASHMFFGRATSGFNSMFATHPPLAERIKRIDPSWDGEFTEAGAGVHIDDGASATHAGASGFAGGTGHSTTASASSAAVVASIGQPSKAHLRHAAALLHRLPKTLRAAAHEPYGARAVIYALLLDSNADVRDRQLAHLQGSAAPGVFDETSRLASDALSLDASLRLPLLELTIPALRALSPSQRTTFDDNLGALVEADERIDLFEWSLYHILLRDLTPELARHTRVRYKSVKAVAPACTLLLSVLAYIGQREADDAERAFEQGAVTLSLIDVQLLPPDQCRLDLLTSALEQLDAAAPAVKRSVLEAAVACVMADAHVTAAEAEVLRAVAALISCPMPPIIASDAE